MFGRTAFAAVAALTLGSLGVFAQTQAQLDFARQLRACSETIDTVNFGDVRRYEYDDTGSFNATFSYDPAYCDSTMTVFYVRLTDNDNGDVVTCSRQQFAPERTTIFSECQTVTRGTMAKQARDGGGNDWEVTMNYGNRAMNAVNGITRYFALAPPESANPPEEETPPPVASGSFQKKRGTIEQQHRFDCPTGQTYCWTGERQEYACMDTSSDVTACGRCPYAPSADTFGGDCTSIEGADDVQCYKSNCVVNACQRGFQVSLDRTKCLDGSKKSIIARGVLF